MSTLKILYFSSPWRMRSENFERKVMEQFIFPYFHCWGRWGVMHLSVVCPISNTCWAWQGKGGELTCPNGTSPHTWATILRTIPLHIHYKYLISTCCAQCVTGRYGYLWNSQRIFQIFVTQRKGSIWEDWDNPDLVTTPWGRFRQQIRRLSPTSAPGMPGRAYQNLVSFIILTDLEQ